MPIEGVIRILEGALEEARKGNVIGLMLLTEAKNGDVTHQTFGITDRYKTMGYLAHAMNKIANN